jgi:acyl-CoA synthetase (AMP-forming)/AMP-acid ligase II
MSDVYVHIGEMLARNARMYPDDVALVERIPAEKKRWEITWKEFDDRANQFSNILVKKGVKKGDKVIHFMNNSIDWLVCYFGIVRTGAWVVPLNFRFTAEDLKYCAGVADAGAMVYDQEFTDRVEAAKKELDATGIKNYICVGPETPAWAEPYAKLMEGAPATPLNVELTYTDPCGLYFTSGTTGQPKPILLTHKNMVSACITENEHHKQTRKDNFILIPPLYHTGAKMHWFGSFIVGAKAVILKGVSPQWVLEAVNEEGGTIVWLLVPWAQDPRTTSSTSGGSCTSEPSRSRRASSITGKSTSRRWITTRTSACPSRPVRAVSTSAPRTRTRSVRSASPASTGKCGSSTRMVRT